MPCSRGWCGGTAQSLHRVISERHDGRLFLLAFALYLAGVLLAYTRWFLLVRAVALPFRYRDAVRLGLVGTLFNFLIPGAIGGDFVRAAFLCREQGRRTRPIASVVVDRLAGLLGLFGLAFLTGILGWSRLAPSVRSLVTAAGIAVGVTAAILATAFLPGLGHSHSRRRAELATVGASYRRRIWVLPLAGTLAGITHTFNVLAFYALSQGLFADVPGLLDHFLIVPLVLFSTGVPLPLGALGVTEQVSAKLFDLADFPGGAVVMMAFRLLQLGGALLAGVVYLANVAQVRDLTVTAQHLDEDLEAELGPPG